MSELAVKVPTFALLVKLEQEGHITATSLTLTDADMPFDQYEALFAMFGKIKGLTSFLIGDGLNWGEGVYGDRYVQAAEATGLSPGTLMNYASVCRNVAKNRRREDLTFGHHAEVAKLEPEQQAAWLQRAVDERWTRSQMRLAILDATRQTTIDDPSTLPGEAGGSDGSANGTATAAGTSGVVVELRPFRERLEHVTRTILSQGQQTPTGDVLVPAPLWAQLKALYGETED